MRRKVLVTGASGFIGRHLIARLRRQRINIICIVRDDKFQRGFVDYVRALNKLSDADGGGSIFVESCDITNEREVESLISRNRPDLVVHMAALTPVRFSWERAKEYMQVNYFGTINIVEAMRRAGCRNLLFYSTAEVMRPADRPLHENDHVYPTTPYAASKLAAEGYVVAQPDIRSVVVRPVNTFDRSILGINDEAMGYFVEKAITSLILNGRVDFDGSPNVKRTWIHVDYHVDRIMRIISRMLRDEDQPRIMHVTARSHYTCGEIFDAITTIIRAEFPQIELRKDDLVTWNNRPRPYDPPALMLASRYHYPRYDVWEALRKAIHNWLAVLTVRR